MLPSSPFLFLLVLNLLLLTPSTLLSSPLPTVAIARSTNSTLVCALVIDAAASDQDHHALNCTEFPSRRVHSYSFGSAYYTGVAGGDGFLCGLSTHLSTNVSAMLWWEFPHRPGNRSIVPTVRRVYQGHSLEDVGAGGTHVCGLIGKTRRISCWRWPRFSRTPLDDVEYIDLAVGNDFLCGLLPSGKIRCFGDENTVVGNEPEGNYTVVAAGARHACALTKEDQYLYCWGSGSPVLSFEAKLQFRALALGRNRTCAIRSNGTAACWGDNGFRLPESLEKVGFISIAAKDAVFCGVRTSNYSLVCWGSQAFDADSLVFDRVLPGPCKASCPCLPLKGSATLCPSGTVICDLCDLKRIQIPSSPSNGNGSTGGDVDNNNEKKSNNRRRIYLLVGAVGVGIAFLALFTAFVFPKDKCLSRIHDDPPRLPRAPVSPTLRVSGAIAKGHSTTVEEFPLQFLHSITNGFSEEHKIGSGSFGSVYRGTLDDGRHVAIKRAEFPASSAAACSRTKAKEQAFLSELALLSRVNHRNLVRLLGFCADLSELLLVYEYMPNGTLHDHLHRLPTSPLSSWAPRLRVALDAARGLEYLHRYAVPPIIHRDIKPSNILLDDTWTAKLADFGLCLVGEESHVVFPTAGTLGYMDPEYYRSERLTTKSDVYSFGVVLLELLTGRKAIHKRESYNGEPCNVVEFAVPSIMADDVQEVLDPALPPPRPCEIEAVQQLGYLAADCVSYEGKRRPEMAEVVDELQQAVAACYETAPAPLVRSMTAHSV